MTKKPHVKKGEAKKIPTPIHKIKTMIINLQDDVEIIENIIDGPIWPPIGSPVVLGDGSTKVVKTVVLELRGAVAMIEVRCGLL